MDYYKIIIDSLVPVFSSLCLTVLTGLLWAVWSFVRGKIAESRYAKFLGIVDPIIASTRADARVQATWAKITDPSSPGGCMPTPSELRELAVIVEEAARPQLNALSGFAMDRAKEEVLAAVRRFFHIEATRPAAVTPSEDDPESPELPPEARQVATE